MFIEVHVLQNYALSNLNRDDTGAPKTCEFGGVRRARISSQCLKRAVRTYFRENEVLPAPLLSQRTKRLTEALTKHFTAKGLGIHEAEPLAANVLVQLGLKTEKSKTQYLLLLGNQEIARLADLALETRSALESANDKADKALQAKLWEVLDGGDAVDLALFGRMIADKPDRNVDAAVQMAHAMSTNAVSMELDFFSAIDDLQPDDADEGAGAGMLGTIPYNSACYYRYANIDLRQLAHNLGGDMAKADTGLRAFLHGMIHAVPTGKQTASAAQNPPSFIMTTVRDHGLWSLANAFVQPVRVGQVDDLVGVSVEALLTYFGQLAGMYGTDGLRYSGFTTYVSAGAQPPLSLESSAPALLNATMHAVADARG